MTGYLNPLFPSLMAAASQVLRLPARDDAVEQTTAKSRQVRRAEERRKGKPKLGPVQKRRGS